MKRVPTNFARLGFLGLRPHVAVRIRALCLEPPTEHKELPVSMGFASRASDSLDQLYMISTEHGLFTVTSLVTVVWRRESPQSST